jgi:hypothetical protein
MLNARQFWELPELFRRMNLRLRSDDRGREGPLVAFGGSAMGNPAPIADFADLVAFGDGEGQTDESRKEFGERILQSEIGDLRAHSSQVNQESEKLTPRSVGGFHKVNGPNLGRLPKYVPQKNDAMQAISPYLIKDEKYVWDGVYNTKDAQLSTRYGNAQSMGRVFVTNFRLMFWSDDYDKPHIGVFYQDITSWKTNWMPMKSRGVIMYVSGRKIIFAANSTAMEHATSQKSYPQN